MVIIASGDDDGRDHRADGDRYETKHEGGHLDMMISILIVTLTTNTCSSEGKCCLPAQGTRRTAHLPGVKLHHGCPRVPEFGVQGFHV